MLEAAAEARGVSVAEVIRQAVQEHLARREGDRMIPLLDETLSKHVDRLAALLAKVYVAAASASWQANYLVGRDPKADPVDIMRAAVTRALVDLRRKGSAVGEATEEEYQDAEERAGLPPVK